MDVYQFYLKKFQSQNSMTDPFHAPYKLNVCKWLQNGMVSTCVTRVVVCIDHLIILASISISSLEIYERFRYMDLGRFWLCYKNMLGTFLYKVFHILLILWVYSIIFLIMINLIMFWKFAKSQIHISSLRAGTVLTHTTQCHDTIQ